MKIGGYKLHSTNEIQYTAHLRCVNFIQLVLQVTLDGSKFDLSKFLISKSDITVLMIFSI